MCIFIVNSTAKVLIRKKSKYRRNGYIIIFISARDIGRTCYLKSTLTIGGQHLGHLLKLNDGSILLDYGIRKKPFRGIGAMLSRNNCETWSNPVFLVNSNVDCVASSPMIP